MAKMLACSKEGGGGGRAKRQGEEGAEGKNRGEYKCALGVMGNQKEASDAQNVTQEATANRCMRLTVQSDSQAAAKEPEEELHRVSDTSPATRARAARLTLGDNADVRPGWD
jgi:hypothetical protein